MDQSHGERHIGLFGATGVGVGAIVGGGILALAGVAFATTGPSAILAFAVNGAIAVLTACSFAEMASAFPQSGGTYTFAKKVLSVEAAFAVGWVVWFASIVAAVLYAIGFGYFAAVGVEHIWNAGWETPPDWLTGKAAVRALAVVATAIYALLLIWKGGGSGQWINVGKVAVFGVLIAGGLWALKGRPATEIRTSLTPLFAAGPMGLFQAMGFTFIALQGFDLIAAVGGEVREPSRTIPRAMFYSLGIALAIYLPLLFVIATVGVEAGASITSASRQNPETIVAIAAQHYLGAFGYWLVIVAALLSMLSALEANLFAASRVALSMARDRTLPQWLTIQWGRRRAPITAVAATALIVVLIVLLVPNVAAAGAASSLIFLVTFALAHGISILVRRRGRPLAATFRGPLFPMVPIAGASACTLLAVYQGVAVPSAGFIAAGWLTIGGVLFLSLFAHRARVVDASSEALDPEVSRLRGRSPLVLAPIANPANAASMVAVAHALAPRDVGRVLLLSIVTGNKVQRQNENPRPLSDVQSVIGAALASSLEADVYPEMLTTIATEPWPEIIRVARVHRCESVLLGLTSLADASTATRLDQLIGAIESDVVVLRAPERWNPAQVERVLVPIGGRGGHDTLRARLLGGLARTGERHVSFLRVLPVTTTERERLRIEGELTRFGRDETRGSIEAHAVKSGDALTTITEHAARADLLILGVKRLSGRRRAFGSFTLEIARRTTCPIIMIGRRT